MTPMTVALGLKILDIILLGVSLAPAAKQSAQSLADFLRNLDGRDPTDDEWDKINAETSILLASIERRAEEALDPTAT